MPRLSIPDRKMFEAIATLKDRGDIRFRQEFCDAIEIPKQNIRQVRLGLQHFTAKQIMRACKKYGINANWVFGFSDQFSRVQAEIKHITKGKTKSIGKKISG
jgi:hypothetical protein